MKRMKLLLIAVMLVSIGTLDVVCESKSNITYDADSVLLWKGSKELDWTPLVIKKALFKDFKVGTVVILEFTLGSQDWWNFAVMSPDWTELSVPGSDSAQDNYIGLEPGQTTFAFTLTSEILKKAKANGLSFAGNPGITVTRVYAN